MELTPRTTSLTPPSVIDLTSSDGDPWLRLMERNPLIFQHLLNVTKHNLRTGSTNNRGIESGKALTTANKCNCYDIINFETNESLKHSRIAFSIINYND